MNGGLVKQRCQHVEPLSFRPELLNGLVQMLDVSLSLLQ